jgi:hypothetical protein
MKSRESGTFAAQSAPEAPGRNRISKLRHIARQREVMSVEGHPVDPREAQTVVAVHDALSGPEARHALMSPLRVAKVVEWASILSSGRALRRRTA